MLAPAAQLEEFRTTVRRLRRGLDLSQEALARRADVSAKHLSEIERGHSDPRLSTVIKLAYALEMSLSELCAAFETCAGDAVA